MEMLADPIWNRVTGDSIGDISSGGFLVCRLNSNGSITGKINTYTDAFPTYNDTFIIGDAPTYTNTVTDIITTTMDYTAQSFEQSRTYRLAS